MNAATIDWTGAAIHRVEYAKGRVIFSQGDPCGSVLYIESGTVRLSVVSHTGKEATVAVIEPAHFFGEGCLAGQPLRISTATVLSPSTIVDIGHQELRRQMRIKPRLAEHFMSHMLTRNIRIEADLIDQLFNDVEKRLARTLLMMARYGEEESARRLVPRISQTLLAEMIGTTRSRVNAFMNKFRKLGFIEYNGSLKVNNSLLTVLLHDGKASESGASAAPDDPVRLLPIRRKTSKSE